MLRRIFLFLFSLILFSSCINEAQSRDKRIVTPSSKIVLETSKTSDSIVTNSQIDSLGHIYGHGNVRLLLASIDNQTLYNIDKACSFISMYGVQQVCKAIDVCTNVDNSIDWKNVAVILGHAVNYGFTMNMCSLAMGQPKEILIQNNNITIWKYDTPTRVELYFEYDTLVLIKNFPF